MNCNNTKKRILLWGLSDSKHLGGIEQYLLNLVKKADKSKYQFCFLVLKDSIPCFYEELTELGCHFYFITSRRKNYFKNIKEIKILFDKEHFDIVHCHLSSLSYIAPCIIANKKNIKLIVHSHNSFFNGSVFSAVLHIINSFRIKHINATRLAVSKEAGEWLFNNNYLVINNDIDIDKYTFNNNSRLSIREHLHIDDDTTVLINVASFKPEKNHMFLLSVFSKCLDVSHNCVLLLAGDGDGKEKIINESKRMGLIDRIFFLGTINNVNDYLSAADIFVIPSIHEGYPLALIEAQCCGLPCIVSDRITSEAIYDELCTVEPIDNLDIWVDAINSIKKTDRVKNTGIAHKWLNNKNNSNIKIETIYDRL